MSWLSTLEVWNESIASVSMRLLAKFGIFVGRNVRENHVILWCQMNPNEANWSTSNWKWWIVICFLSSLLLYHLESRWRNTTTVYWFITAPYPKATFLGGCAAIYFSDGIYPKVPDSCWNINSLQGTMRGQPWYVCTSPAKRQVLLIWVCWKPWKRSTKCAIITFFEHPKRGCKSNNQKSILNYCRLAIMNQSARVHNEY